jgi:hypothetical protein
MLRTAPAAEARVAERPRPTAHRTTNTCHLLLSWTGSLHQRQCCGSDELKVLRQRQLPGEQEQPAPAQRPRIKPGLSHLDLDRLRSGCCLTPLHVYRDESRVKFAS